MSPAVEINNLTKDYEVGFLRKRKVRELVEYCAELFGYARAERKRRAADLLARVRLEEKSWDKQLRKFSKGMLQRVGLAQALVNDPSVVFLDEPMSGLDPVGRREVRDLIAQLRTQGTTVFFCSHILADIEVLCDRAAILQKGRLAHIGRLADLRQAAGDTRRMELVCAGANLARLKSELEQLEGAQFVQ